MFTPSEREGAFSIKLTYNYTVFRICCIVYINFRKEGNAKTFTDLPNAGWPARYFYSCNSCSVSEQSVFIVHRRDEV